MLALTLRHPWPYMILHCGKRIENRSWRPNPRIRPGTLIALHGGQNPYPSKTREAARQVAALIARGLCPPLDLDATIRPGLVAVFRFGGVRDPFLGQYGGPWHDRDCYGWILDEVRPLPVAIPAVGKQGLWTLAAEQERAVRAGLEGAR